MKRSAWLVAAFLASLAVPALAGTPGPAPDAGGPPKYDFTKRPDLRTYAPREKAPASTPLTEKQAKALAKDLFDNYLNTSGLYLFRFHKRTQDEPPMTLEDLNWADEILAKEAKLSDELQAEADAALKAGIERRVVTPGAPRSAMGRPFLGRLRAIHSRKPTLDDLRQWEYEARSAIGLNLYVILHEESEPADQADAEQRAEADKNVVEARAELAEALKNIREFRQADAEREELRSSSILESKERVKRATSGSFEKRAAPSAGHPSAGSPPSAGGGSSGKTAEEAIREANSRPRAALPRKGKPAPVPAP